jgi:competence protein ComEA
MKGEVMFAHSRDRSGAVAKSRTVSRFTIEALPKRRIFLGVAGILTVLLLLSLWHSSRQQLIVHGSDSNRSGEDASSLLLPVDSAQSTESATIGSSQPEQTVADVDPVDTRAGASVTVHISGAVALPGVVEMPAGSRLVDGADACGGLADDAACDYINLASVLIDGTHIYIPRHSDIATLREQGISVEQVLLAGGCYDDLTALQVRNTTAISDAATASSSNAATTGSGFPVNINTADSSTLQTVPGIGPVTAQRILDYRNQHGSFTSLDELMMISGIGEKRLADIKPYLTCK